MWHELPMNHFGRLLFKTDFISTCVVKNGYVLAQDWFQKIDHAKTHT